ncbi:AraC-like DNA-binding protein [Arthrobacter pascens]|nr:AraC-like DNA-binding protein [Arthrobacter pascens]
MLMCWRSPALRWSCRLRNVALNLADLEWILAPLPQLAELGRRVGASEHALSRLTRDELGMTYTVWRNQLRLHLTTLMLAGGRVSPVQIEGTNRRQDRLINALRDRRSFR